MDFNSTVKGSMLEGFYPAGWDFAKIDACIDAPETITKRQAFWNKDFTPVQCDSLGEFETYMGHEIAMQIKLAKDRNEQIAFILPVGPMGMYKWVVYFLKEWQVSCEHVHTFNMDEWADGDGNTLAPDNTGSFQYAMEQALPKIIYLPIPTRLPSLKKRVRNSCLCTVSVECAISRFGNRTLRKIIKRWKNGKKRPIVSAQKFIL